MGCTGSKQARRDIHGHGRHHHHLSPYIRTQSLPISLQNYHPINPTQSDETVHVHAQSSSVTLTSSTLGSLALDKPSGGGVGSPVEGMMKNYNDCKERSDKVAVSWSEMIERHCKWAAPLTPTKTPPNEPEVINVWELMAGLEEDASPVCKPSIDRSFSFDVSKTKTTDANARSGSGSGSGSLIGKLDPEIIYAFLSKREIPKFTGLVRERVDEFQERINASIAKAGPPGGGKKVVLYFTSLRGVRQTYEDCWDTKVILQSYGVVIDERDVALHGGYKDELRGVLKERFTNKLPQVFADGRHLGGAEEVRRMHEGGELGKVLGRCESVPVKKTGQAKKEPCGGCGGVRFVPCDACSGSCKVFVEEDHEEEINGGFVRCKECNENGLIRCPLCC